MNDIRIADSSRNVTMQDLAAQVPNALAIGPFGSDLKTTDYVPDGVPVVFVKNVRPNEFTPKDCRYVSDDKAEQLAAHRVTGGDVLITKMGLPPCVAAVYPSDAPDGIVTADIIKLTPDPNTVDPRYVVYFLNSSFAQRQVEMFTNGVTRPKVTLGAFRAMSIPLPPLAKQKRIADILDKADAIRRKRLEAVEQFGLLTESIFNEMFAHQLTSARWSDLSNFLEELRYGTSNKSGDGGYATLRIPNIVRGIIDLADLKTVMVSDAEFSKLQLLSGDVLFVRTNGNPDYVGRCAVFEPSQMTEAGLNADKVIYASYLIRARLQLNRLRPVFLQSLLQTSLGRKNVREKCRTSAGQYNINTQGIGALQIPDIDVKEQIYFEHRVASLRPVHSSLMRAQTEANDLFNSLVQCAFKGEL